MTASGAVVAMMLHEALDHERRTPAFAHHLAAFLETARRLTPPPVHRAEGHCS